VDEADLASIDPMAIPPGWRLIHLLSQVRYGVNLEVLNLLKVKIFRMD